VKEGDAALEDLVPMLDRLCQANGLGRLRTCVPVPNAAINLAFRADITNGQTVMIRVNQRDQYEPKWEREREVYELLHRVAPDVPVPTVLLTDSTRSVVPWPVQVSTWLKGVPGDDGTIEIHRLPHAELGRLVARLHSVSVPYFGWPRPARGTAADHSWPEYVKTLATEALASASYLTRGERIAVGRWIHERVLTLGLDRNVTPRLVHSDLHWGNVLLAERGRALVITGLVDFEWALGAHPAYEWAWATRQVRHNSAVLRAYRASGGAGPDPRAQGLYQVLKSLEMVERAARDWGTDHPAFQGHLKIVRDVAKRYGP
jgi:aminoglycoside phosphotransferase (APT) family kinase protein